MSTHAQIARALTVGMDQRALAYAMRDAVIDADFSTLERMLPGVAFTATKTGPDQWALVGKCADGSEIVWGVGE